MKEEKNNEKVPFNQSSSENVCLYVIFFIFLPFYEIFLAWEQVRVTDMYGLSGSNILTPFGCSGPNKLTMFGCLCPNKVKNNESVCVVGCSVVRV